MTRHIAGETQGEKGYTLTMDGSQGSAPFPGETKMEWITDEVGIKRWTHEGWVLTEYNWTDQLYVSSPDRDAQVDVDSDGVSVKGETSYGHEPYATRVDIPWPVIEAIVDWKRSRTAVKP